MQVLEYIPNGFWVVLHLSLAALAVYHNLLYKRDSKSALSWIMISLLVPYGGPMAYYLFGINRINLRARNAKGWPFFVDYELAEKRPMETEDNSFSDLKAVGHSVTGLPIISGNQVRPLHNGDAAYPLMLSAIANARKSILLTTYIFQADNIGQKFTDALYTALKNGVDVRVIIDGIGELYSFPRCSSRLRRLGIKTTRFLPPKLFPPSIYVNLRNHRKLLVIDNSVGFVGGMNIGDRNTTTEDEAISITDLHFEVKGPIINQLSEMFNNDWHYAGGEEQTEEQKNDLEIEPRIKPENAGDMDCRLVVDGPDEHLDSLDVLLQSVISCATQSILIMTPYFLPNRELLSALQSAFLRGVKVKIVLPEKNNLFYIEWANQNLLAELLKWGVECAYQPAPFCHSKMICIDSNYSLVGSANLDPRSLRLNFELGLEVFSQRLNTELTEHFENVFKRSRRIQFEDIKNRSIFARLRDSTVALFSPYL